MQTLQPERCFDYILFKNEIFLQEERERRDEKQRKWKRERVWKFGGQNNGDRRRKEQEVEKKSEGYNKMEKVTAIDFTSNFYLGSSFWKPQFPISDSSFQHGPLPNPYLPIILYITFSNAQHFFFFISKRTAAQLGNVVLKCFQCMSATNYFDYLHFPQGMLRSFSLGMLSTPFQTPWSTPSLLRD